VQDELTLPAKTLVGRMLDANHNDQLDAVVSDTLAELVASRAVSDESRALLALYKALHAITDDSAKRCVKTNDDMIRRAIAARQSSVVQRAIHEAYAANDLRALAVDWHDRRGLQKQQIIDELTLFLLGVDDEDDRIGGLLDALTGFCASECRMWPDESHEGR
jgi:hypothetical protein